MLRIFFDKEGKIKLQAQPRLSWHCFADFCSIVRRYSDERHIIEEFAELRLELDAQLEVGACSLPLVWRGAVFGLRH